VSKSIQTLRIFAAGFQHETNTFAPSPADWQAFETLATFPSRARGLLHGLMQRNLPISGFMRAAKAAGHGLIEGCYWGATPSAHITHDAFERIAADIVDHIRDLQGHIDAIYLDLHGAAVAEHVDDCEGELLQRIRAVVGPHLPLVASLDLHANVSERMVALADALVSYRKYPHTDMAETGVLALALLHQRIALGHALPRRFVRLPFLIPINAQTTWMQPAKGIYEHLATLDAQHQATLSFCPGFPAADIADCGPSLWGYAATQQAADAAVQALAAIAGEPKQWRLAFATPDEAVAQALTRANTSDCPVLIADTQDNPGAGSDSNTTGMLHALLRSGAGLAHPGRVALGLVFDPQAASVAHAAGVGAVVNMPVGVSVRTFDGRMSDASVHAEWEVMQLSAGDVQLKGDMSTNAQVNLGLCARLRHQGVDVLVASKKKQMLDKELFRFLGTQPEQAKLLVLKSSAHFRADFSPLVADAAQDILVAKAQGSMAADPRDLPWTKLPHSTRQWP
jgi:microcystin degradation protein MlrC